MNRLNRQERAKIIACLVEGNSIRATCRMTGAAKGTVIKLLADVGDACKAYHDKHVRNVTDKHVRNVTAKRIQCDEIWSFCYAKQKNVPADFAGVFGYGDVWTWTALDADSKLMVAYSVAGRDATSANNFVRDLAGRLSNRVQLTTDAYRMYLVAVDKAFGGFIDYAMLDKIYSSPKGKESATRYSPGECCGTFKRRVAGNPNKADISTSHVERQNLHDAYVYAPVYAPDQRFLQESREPGPCRSPAFHVLQLRADSSVSAGYPCHGSRAYGPRLDS
jgi:hypothetical protein